MVGNAFSELDGNAFPLVPSNTYKSLKADLAGRLLSLFKNVGTPAESPERTEFSRVDFVVQGPNGEVTTEHIKRALGAQHVHVPGQSKLSHYALPLDKNGKLYQVDVRICSDKEEMDRVMFFQSYGDMGMILGVLARAHGLSLGTNGLKVLDHDVDESHPPSFPLSKQFPLILAFFGLRIETWKRGFKNNAEVFDWVSSSRFFAPRLLSESQVSKEDKKAVKTRVMYQAFLAYSHQLKQSGNYDTSRPVLDKKAVIREALVYFGKKEEFNEAVATNHKRIVFKQKFTGKHVMEWTGLHGTVIRDIMNGMRGKVGDDGIMKASVEDLRKLALGVQQELKIVKKN